MCKISILPNTAKFISPFLPNTAKFVLPFLPNTAKFSSQTPQQNAAKRHNISRKFFAANA